MKGIRNVFIIIIMLSMCFNIMASEKSHIKNAKKLIEMTYQGDFGNSMIKLFKAQLDEQMRQLRTMYSDQKAFDKAYNNYIEKCVKQIKEAISLDNIIDEMAEIYVAEFTEKEIKDFMKFYKSKSGKKFIKTMPIVTDKAMTIGMKQVEPIQPQIMKYAEEFQNDLLVILSQQVEEIEKDSEETNKANEKTIE